MKKLTTVAAALVLASVSFTPTWAQSLTLEVGDLALKPDSQSTDGVEPVADREIEPTLLVEFKLSNGNQVQFFGVPEDGEMVIGEISDAGYERFLVDPNAAPAEIFLELAPADLPVPRMIADTDKELFKWHDKVDVIEKAVAVDVGITAPAVAKAGSGSCASGNAGASYFEEHHCNTLGGPGYGTSEKYCDEGMADWIQRTSNSRRRATYTRMASCGSGTNHLRHYYGTVSGYTTQLNIYVAPQKVVDYWSAKTGVKRYRRVRMEESASSGWVRGWTAYHSEVAGGWF